LKDTKKKLFDLLKENGVWRSHTNVELTNLYIKPDIISEIRKGRLRWLGHMERMPEERKLKKVFKNTLEGKRSVGNRRKRWLDDVENDLKKIGVRGWRKTTKDGDI
jgi:hypothetical protein